MSKTTEKKHGFTLEYSYEADDRVVFSFFRDRKKRPVFKVDFEKDAEDYLIASFVSNWEIISDAVKAGKVGRSKGDDSPEFGMPVPFPPEFAPFWRPITKLPKDNRLIWVYTDTDDSYACHADSVSSNVIAWHPMIADGLHPEKPAEDDIVKFQRWPSQQAPSPD